MSKLVNDVLRSVGENYLVQNVHYTSNMIQDLDVPYYDMLVAQVVKGLGIYFRKPDTLYKYMQVEGLKRPEVMGADLRVSFYVLHPELLKKLLVIVETETERRVRDEYSFRDSFGLDYRE